jgi:hypothetical protein
MANLSLKLEYELADQKIGSKPKLNGVIERLVGDSLGYLRADVDRRTFSFVPAAIEKYKGQSFEEMGFVEKGSVKFSLDPNGQIVTRIIVGSRRAHRPKPKHRKIVDAIERVKTVESRTVGAKSAPQSTKIISDQIELHPNDNATGDMKTARALPPSTRDFGKLIDTTNLWPGDLLLTRNVQADDYVSKIISEVQRQGGYGPADVRWVHAAMYLGDGDAVVEATFENPLVEGKVKITSLDDYSDGTSILRFRRSKFIKEERDGWRLCVRALSRLKESYDRSFAVGMAMIEAPHLVQNECEVLG